MGEPYTCTERHDPVRSNSMRPLFLRFVNNKSAARAIECGLIAAGIAVAIISLVMAQYHIH